MKSASVFRRLSELGDAISEVSRMDERWDEVAKRDKMCGDKNVLLCPNQSMEAMRHLRLEVGNFSKEAPRTLHEISVVAQKTKQMLADSDSILEYLERETSRAEKLLQPHGFIPWSDSSIPNVEDMAISSKSPSHKICELPQGVNVAEKSSSEADAPKSQKPVVKSEPDGENKENDISCEKFSIAMPDSPEVPKFVKEYQTKSDLLPSPKAPVVKEQKLTDYNKVLHQPSHLFHGISVPDSPKLQMPLSQDSVESPDIRKIMQSHKAIFFDPPYSAEKQKMAKEISEGQLAEKHQGMPANFFAALQSPQCEPVYQHDSKISSPDLVLHSRRSVLAQPPCNHQDEDDTVMNLFSRGSVPNVQLSRSPQSPDFVQHIVPEKRHPESTYQLPETPPSPNLGCNYENLSKPPGNLSSLQIKESQYSLLPDYITRIISLQQSNECLKKVLEASFCLHGDQHSNVITETKISEVTSLDQRKIKPFVFLLQKLKIIEGVRGTAYYSINI